MNPYYQDDYATIYHGDCREILPTLPKVDLVLTDPPYGIGIDGQNKSINRRGVSIRKAYEFMGWDGSAPTQNTISIIIRSAKKAIIWGANYMPVPVGNKVWLVWDKGQRGLTMSDCEIAWSNLASVARVYTCHRSRLWRENPKHPTQKPSELMAWCIAQAGEPQTILDPFMGSGTTLRAAKDLQRQSIGIEIEERYCEIAANRLAQEVLPLEFGSNE